MRGIAEEADLIAPREVPLPAVAEGFTGMVVGVIGAWLGMEPRPQADDAARWIWRIATGLPALGARNAGEAPGG